ncbi:hypothetical protein [Bacillus sp. NPDC077027]
MKKFMMIITTALLLGTILSVPVAQHSQHDAQGKTMLLSSRGAGS